MSWSATPDLALPLTVCPSIAAPLAVTLGVDGPVSSDALPVDPYLTFGHTTHVQGYWLIPFWCIEIGLQKGKILRLFFELQIVP